MAQDKLEIGAISGSRMYLGTREVFDDHYVKGGEWRTEEIWEITERCFDCGYTNCFSMWETNFWVCPICGRPK